MKKYRILIIVLIISTNAFGQVGVNTQYPKGTFHIDGGKDNPADNSNPDPAQSANDFIVMPDGKVGLKNANPDHTLDIYQNVTTGNATMQSVPNIALRLINPNNAKSIIQRFTAYNSSGVEKTFHLGIAPDVLGGNGVISIGRISATDLRINLVNGNIGLGAEPNDIRKLLVGGSMKVNNDNSNKYVVTFRLGADGSGYGNSGENRGIQFISESTTATGNPFIASITAGSTAPTGWTANGRYMSLNLYDDTNPVLTLKTTDAGVTKRVGIGTTTPATLLDVNGSVKIGNDGDTGPEGTIRYNSALKKFQGRTDTGWVDLN